MFNRVKNYFIRRHKAKPMIWLSRYDRAVDRMWRRFDAMPINRTNLEWLNRNNNRLIKLIPPCQKLCK